ncbi:MAG: c-type cytochrome [Rhodobacteraceae bacterium]|nr:c-type cytochrome [Paracoccaceae bacterium]
MVLDAELVEKGKKVFKKCKACHKIGDKAKNGVGPILNGIYGRAAAEVADYSYSDAMTAASAEGLIWDEESLRQYLKKPKDMIPKTKMAFAGLRKDKDLDAIMEFLKSISQEP